MVVMIPKNIHYCWFGGQPLPELATKCINSWKAYFPEYSIIEWNESNFDINCCAYVREAYKAKKWAFVSDYARFFILYNYGGIYFDTDVEVIKDMSEILRDGAFMGTEPVSNDIPGFQQEINPGLGLAVEAGNEIYKQMLNFYENTHYIFYDGSVNDQTVVKYTTNLLYQYGYKGINKIQEINGIKIYPPQYFCPQNYETGELNITEKTYSIHHFAATWQSLWDKIILRIERCKKGRKSVEYKLRRVMSFPFRVINKIDKMGIINTIGFILKKISSKKSI